MKPSVDPAIGRILSCLGLLLAGSWLVAAQPGFEVEIKALDFQSVAGTAEEQVASDLMWRRRGFSVYGSAAQETPATAVVQIPRDGSYYVWAHYQVSEVRRKAFSVTVDGKELVFGWKPYGRSAAERPDLYQSREADAKKMIWTRQEVVLPPGAHELALTARPSPPEGRWASGGHPPLVEAVVVTNNPDFDPAKK